MEASLALYKLPALYVLFGRFFPPVQDPVHERHTAGLGDLRGDGPQSSKMSLAMQITPHVTEGWQVGTFNKVVTCLQI